jgi:hypothetical protein
MGGSVAERAVEPKRNESLRQQFETTIQENIKQAIFCLPLDQLELFDSFLVEQQKQFNSIFLSQRVNHLYQKYVQHKLKQSITDRLISLSMVVICPGSLVSEC